MRITVLVDDIVPEGMEPAHGFSALVEAGGSTILFDAGPDGELLMEALGREGKEPADIDVVVVSHHHRDHTGGLARVLYDHPRIPVSVPVRSASKVANMLPREALVLGEEGPREVAPGVIVTGDLDGDIPEQVMLLETARGRVMLVGCGHPGIHMLMRVAGGSLGMLIGGIHDLSPEDLPVEGVGAMILCHCTPRKRIHTHRYQDVELGAVGTSVELEDPPTPAPPG
jgi:7,8-dihydropterin-6-yl-methyl-4-(beta-D-ribofuranosyl)aminobenzene 5'-phosphate synthase